MAFTSSPAATNDSSGGADEAGGMALTNAAGRRMEFSREQRETESRERALSLLKSRVVKERVEQVLKEFVDISGYFRAGYGRNDEGTINTPTTPARSDAAIGFPAGCGPFFISTNT